MKTASEKFIYTNTAEIYPIGVQLRFNPRHNSDGPDNCVVDVQENDLELAEVWLIANDGAVQYETKHKARMLVCSCRMLKCDSNQNISQHFS